MSSFAFIVSSLLRQPLESSTKGSIINDKRIPFTKASNSLANSRNHTKPRIAIHPRMVQTPASQSASASASAFKPTAEPKTKPSMVYYFAYGSNLSPSRFGPSSAIPLRRATPTHTTLAILPNHKLVFNVPGIPILEPAFANIVSHVGKEVHGVIYEITEEEMERLARSEGVGLGGRIGGGMGLSISKVEKVVVVRRDNGELVEAQTLVFMNGRSEEMVPSRRYQELIINGAQHWGIDPQYVEDLRNKWTRPVGNATNKVRQSSFQQQEQEAKTKSEFTTVFSANRKLDPHIEQFVQSKEFLTGSIRLTNPAKYDTVKEDISKPLLVYFPGIDGSSLSILPHIKELNKKFRLRSVIIPPGDFSNWYEMVNVIHEQIQGELEVPNSNQSVHVFGESMGAIAVLFLADQFPGTITSVAILNSATSFTKTPSRPFWQFLAPNLPENLYNAVPYFLVPQIYDLQFLLSQFRNPSSAWKALQAFSMINVLADLLPNKTLQHRLNLIDMSPITDRQLKKMRAKVCVIAAPNDLLIGSLGESERLVKLIPNSYRYILKSGGHASMTDLRLDFASILSQVFTMNERLASVDPMETYYTSSLRSFVKAAELNKPARGLFRSPVGNDNKPFAGPTMDDIEAAFARNELLWKVFSPVFIGAENIPRSLFEIDRPIILVGNHTMFGVLDIPFIVQYILEKRQVLVRGMAHPMIFYDGEKEQNDSDKRHPNDTSRAQKESKHESSDSKKKQDARPTTTQMDPRGGMRGTFETFGAVKVTPRATYRLLKDNEAILLFPGGAREAYKLKNEKHTVHWPEEPEFVRFGLRFNAIIVPVSTVGPDDSFNVVYDSKDILSTPILGDYVRNRAGNFGPAVVRKWQGQEASKKEALDFISPIAVPGVPRRVYFKFGEPIDLRALENEVRQRKQEPLANVAGEAVVIEADGNRKSAGSDDDKQVVRTMYRYIKTQLQKGIRDLEERRKSDVYDQKPLRRLLFEYFNQARAPTVWNQETRDGYFDFEE